MVTRTQFVSLGFFGTGTVRMLAERVKPLLDQARGLPQGSLSPQSLQGAQLPSDPRAFAPRRTRR